MVGQSKGRSLLVVKMKNENKYLCKTKLNVFDSKGTEEHVSNSEIHFGESARYLLAGQN